MNRSTLLLALFLGACSSGAAGGSPASQPSSSADAEDPRGYAELPAVPPGHQVATFAGGCFWCMESDFQAVRGVIAVTSGYTGGHVERPSYEQVGSRTTGHTEAIHVIFDPKVVGYRELLERFWHSIDPTTDDRQFCDVGDEYRPEIFVHDAEQRRLAEASKQQLATTFEHGPIKVRITDAPRFWPAERYHQDFFAKNPRRYTTYRLGCGRDRRLKELWGDAAGH